MNTALLIILLLFQATLTPAARGPRLNPLQGAGSIANFGSRLSNNRKPTSISAPSLSIPSGSSPITPPPQTAASSILAAPSSAWDPAGKDLAEELSDLFLGSDSSSSSSAAPSSGATTASCDSLCTTCASALETFSLCASVSGAAFVSGDADVVATCLCNDWIADAQTYSWVGPLFDAPYGSCVQHVRTEAAAGVSESDVVSSWAAMEGFCSKVSASWWAQRAMMQTTTMPVETGSASTAAPKSVGSGGLEVGGALLWAAVSIALLGPVLYAF